MIESAAPASSFDSSRYWKIQFYMLCGMLLLALIGMGLTQSLENGAWGYWLFVVIVYAGLGLWRSTRSAKLAGKPIQRLIGRELGHWAVLLVFLSIVVFLERKELVTRSSAADFSLMTLAVGCCLAGIHFDWMLMVVGVVLTVMLLALATLGQYTVVLWVIMILVVIAAVAFYFFKTKFHDLGTKGLE